MLNIEFMQFFPGFAGKFLSGCTVRLYTAKAIYTPSSPANLDCDHTPGIDENLFDVCSVTRLILCVSGVLLACLGVGIAYWLIEPRLPSVDVLRDVRLQVPLRVYSADDKLMATIGETRRIPVKIANVPQQLKNAFLAAEDANFYHHSGIDVTGILRALGYMIVKRSLHVPGGSTITQQVARGFFLSSEVSLTRKTTEIFLSFRIEHELTKDEIFELYLNKIFFGNRAYGVASAAEFYYGKTLDQLTIAECAMLASLPKFPSSSQPVEQSRARHRSPRLCVAADAGQWVHHQGTVHAGERRTGPFLCA